MRLRLPDELYLCDLRDELLLYLLDELLDFFDDFLEELSDLEDFEDFEDFFDFFDFEDFDERDDFLDLDAWADELAAQAVMFRSRLSDAPIVRSALKRMYVSLRNFIDCKITKKFHFTWIFF